jgi:hypothetical protein
MGISIQLIQYQLFISINLKHGKADNTPCFHGILHRVLTVNEEGEIVLINLGQDD